MRKLLEAAWARRLYVVYMARGYLKGDARQQVLGYLWWVIEPVCLALVYTFLVSGVFGRGGPGIAFYILSGVLPFRWTRNAVSESIGSIHRHSGIVVSNYVPKLLFPAISICVTGARFVVALLVITLPIVIFANPTPWTSIFLLIAVPVQLLFTLGLALVFSHFGAYYVDTKNVWDVIGRFWLYLSPVIYSLSHFDRPVLRTVMELNPATGFLGLYRFALLGDAPPSATALVSLAAVTVFTLLWGLRLHAKHDAMYGKVL